MGITAEEALGASRSYTDKSIAGGGAIIGKNCTIDSIVPITGGNRVTFKWTLDNGTVQTDTMDVMDGIDGKGIASVTVNAQQHLIITYTDGTITDAGEIDVQSAVDSVNGQTGNVVLGASDVGALPDNTAIPTALSDLSDDTTHRTVTDTEKSTWSGKADISDIPTKLSNFTNDSGFVTSTVNNLTNYYLKSETYTKAEVDALIQAITTLDIQAVSTLPTTDISTTTIYLVPKQDAQSPDVKDEYINLDGTTTGWELIGNTQIDLSNYVTTSDLNTALSTKQDSLTFDNVPTQNSNNPVKSGGVFSTMAVPKYDATNRREYFEGGAAFDGNIDSAPTAGSNNAVSSGGTKTYVDNAVSQLNDEIAKQAVTVTKTSAVTSNSGIIAYICNNFCFVAIDANILSGAADGTVLATGFTKPIYFVAIGRTTKAFDIEINSSGELIIKGTPTTGWVQGSISYMI